MSSDPIQVELTMEMIRKLDVVQKQGQGNSEEVKELQETCLKLQQGQERLLLLLPEMEKVVAINRANLEVTYGLKDETEEQRAQDREKSAKINEEFEQACQTLHEEMRQFRQLNEDFRWRKTWLLLLALMVMLPGAWIFKLHQELKAEEEWSSWLYSETQKQKLELEKCQPNAKPPAPEQKDPKEGKGKRKRKP